MFEGLGAGELIDVITARARASAAADAEKYAAIAALQHLRCTVQGADRKSWAADGWDGAAAEISAALNMGHGRASSEMDIAVMLRDRFPKLAALFHQGLLTGRRAWIIEARTRLVTDPDTAATLDTALADRITSWGPVPEYKFTQLIDLEVERIDPDALIRARASKKVLDFVVGDDYKGEDHKAGTTAYWGRMTVTDAELTRQRIAAMLAGLCTDDPRTVEQRRAAAFAATMAGTDHLTCECGDPACPTAGEDHHARNIHVHVLTDHDSLTAALAMNEQEADAESNEPPPRPRAPQPVAIIPTGAVVPGPLLAELIARGATITPVQARCDAEPGYRPSQALAEFVRLRDLTCRWPGCDTPAEHADIDHTVPYPGGPTHPGGLKCYCRKHHLIKTFHPGWTDRQQPDGTIILTAPTGHTYTTKPGSALLFPTWAPHTPAPPSRPTAPGAHRSIMMPRRKHTRTHTTAARIKAERAHNAHPGDPPPY
jgi:Domain of unknown function (DUF222)